MKEIRTEKTLVAPVGRIWELLSDFDLYPQWNPLFVKIGGPMVAGASFDLLVHLPGMDPFPIRPKLLAVEPESRFCWQSMLFFKGLLTWTFSCQLEVQAPDRLILVQRSEFKGLLAPLFSFGMAAAVTAGMEQLNQAVQRWGEKGNVRCLKC